MTEEIVDAFVVDDNDPAVGPAAAAATQESQTQPPAAGSAPLGPTELIDARGPKDLLRKARRIAETLHEIVIAHDWRYNAGTLEKPSWHLNVEAWLCLGSLLGLVAYPRAGHPRELERVRYRVRVEHFEGTGTSRRLARLEHFDVDGRSFDAEVDVFRGPVRLGAARGLCSRNEPRWARADDFALAGMATTRAQSRAIRQVAGWIPPLAGYASTPAAEVDLRTSSGPTYGPVADEPLQQRLERALAFLLPDVEVGRNGAPADEEAHERVQDVITALVGEADGYMPHVVARAALQLADAVRKASTNPTQEA